MENAIIDRMRLMRHAAEKRLQATRLEVIQLEAEVSALDAVIEDMVERKEAR